MRGFPPGCLALFLFFVLLILIPFFLAEVMLTALAKLGLSAQQSIMAAIGIFLGSMVNIPLTRFENRGKVKMSPSKMFGLERQLFPGLQQQDSTLLAVNLGGCIIPLMIAAYQIVRLSELGTHYILGCGVVVVANIIICRYTAKPVKNMGIAIPALIPAMAAAVLALFFVPEQAPAVAFTAGVLGPLIGADLLHLNEIKKMGTPIASIGGAGTFDGIVLSGIVATLLA
ncbi:DUF1614 domain-containing protein [Balneolaceae bacterium YR4-1]|uniref:DUF1614 domain-containing protein n=1 Tax=Halalkalibaculum roseum TaxID=2709311 RepID=A0A6M1SVH5_9BACT|nr:DUF1614 domain-containing protein [Halalkalibaculum roseum]NGP76126.1 DUF1614 domain-containing protein [Halalkalibaculum roseum]